MQEMLQDLARADPARIVVIPNWADDAAISPLDSGSNPLREDWGLSGLFVAGYSGNMGRGHHFELLLEAATQLANDPDIRILFIGSGARHQAVLGLVEDMGLDRIVFKPFQPRDRLKFSLTVPDVHIITHRDDMYGLQVPSKFYGALAAGRPVLLIGPEEGEIARVIREFDCGFVCSSGRAERDR